MDAVTDMMRDAGDKKGLTPLVLITGPSGAGRTTASNVLEDFGYETIDNLPLSLLPRLLSGPWPERPLALGIDVRNRDFTAQGLIETIDGIASLTDAPMQVLYLDADSDALLRRYSETRRRHPLAPGESAAVGISRELDLLRPIRVRADVLVDTSDLSPNDLRAELERWFAAPGERTMAISVQSFSYKRGLPRGADLVFDCRFLRNPHWEPKLRALDGREEAVEAFVSGDPRAAEFCERTLGLVRFLVPEYRSEGKSYLTVAFGCTGGRHRSVAMAETLVRGLAEEGWPVSIRHRELERTVPRAADGAGEGDTGEGRT